MTRTVAAIGVVTAVCGVVTAFAAIAVVRGWSTGPWTETLLLVGTVIVIFATGGIVIGLAISASLRAATFFFAPAHPPGLSRITSIIEQRQTEQRQTEREPPPEIVVALRAFTGDGRR